MLSKKLYNIFILLLLLTATAQSSQRVNSLQLLRASSSQENIIETARDHSWSLNFTKNERDTLHIIALRVEFVADDYDITTGNGEFGMRGDIREQRHYESGTYKYDNLPHDSLYFAHQLTALANYYEKVSRGFLTLDFSIYPSGSGEIGYKLPNNMTHYSPGFRMRGESVNAYSERKTIGFMLFVRDALNAANNDPANSPFRNLYRDEFGTLRDAQSGHKAAVMIIHAGASYMTDGVLSGVQNSPSDMINAFINRDFFRVFKDTLGLDNDGVTLIGRAGDPFVLSEVMTAPETSNQDGLNWGIQGILVNQVARQLGIPDLFSTETGDVSIGAFCIMDAGYSTGNGFIPPYPSAWVRAFMGWDSFFAAGVREHQYRVSALASSLDKQSFDDIILDAANDTTIILVPLNNNEYYLIENRQRNLSNDLSRFKYELDGTISQYPLHVNLDSNIVNVSGTRSNVILNVYNNDISLPGSGVLVWHIDERILRERLGQNLVNADNGFRGVRLVEADGISDLGVVFVDAFGQAVYDHGGAQDVFPHRILFHEDEIANVRGFGPFTRPSTRSNDGGHTFLKLEINPNSSSPREEQTRNFQNNVVVNYVDSVFLVSIDFDHIVPNWPKRAAPSLFFDPLVTRIARSAGSGDSVNVFALLDTAGRFYLFDIDDNNSNDATNVNNIMKYFEDIAGAFTMPSAIDGMIFVPSSNGNAHELHIYNSLDNNDKNVIILDAAPTSYVSGVRSANSNWALGLANGNIVIGSGGEIVNNITLASQTPANAIAAINERGDVFSAIQEDGTINIANITTNEVLSSTRITYHNALAPFSIVTGDLNNNGLSEIVVIDSRQGVWVYKLSNTLELEIADGWNREGNAPNDWANAYHITNDGNRVSDRNEYRTNPSSAAIADINRDGHLDIVIGGTNGVYALNRRGALLSRWPAYLDNRYWDLRGSVVTTPIVVSTERSHPLVLFSSPTGERATFGVTKLEEAFKDRGVITFRREDNSLDSIWGLSPATIDTVLTLGDSLVYPYIMPGGFVDALTGDASRPLERDLSSWAIPQSRWPLSTGAPAATSPVAWRSAPNAVPDIFAVARDGSIYRWKMNDMISDSLYWAQTGFDAARTFAYGGARISESEIERTTTPITFWNYPNPTIAADAKTTFKYKFSGAAENVRLDIYTITGRRMDTFRMRDGLSGDYPVWNEFDVDLRRYGPGIYRARMEATINGVRHSRFWKMAVVR